MVFFERYLVYPAPALDRSDWQPTWLEYEDVFFESADGTKLHGWFFPCENCQHTFLYCHGNGEQVADNANLGEYLRKEFQASVFIFDYRGYGKSEGNPHEEGIINDGLAASEWVSERTNCETNELVLVGRSIGGGVAVALAAKQGAKALVLESTFSSLVDAAASHYPWLPVNWLMRNRYHSLDHITNYTGPLFQTHGTHDGVVPFKLGQKLFEAAPGTNKQFIEIEGGGHNNAQPEHCYRALKEFLESVDGMK